MSNRDVTPPSAPAERTPPAASGSASTLLGCLGLAVLATAGINALWGLAGGGPTLVGRWLDAVAPLPAWAFFIAAVLGLTATLPRLLGPDDRDPGPLADVAALLLAYMVGIGGAEWVRHALPLPPSTRLVDFGDALVWLLHRSFFLLGAVPLLGTYLWLRPAGASHPAGQFGNWRAETRFPTRGKRSWFWHLGAWTLLVVLPITILFHGQLGFELITSGRLLIFALPVAVMALFNAYAEEVAFRGMLLPAMAEKIGARAALWGQASLFGLLHFGSSPAPLGAFAVLFAATLLGAYFGKSVLETGGLAWAVAAHALADFSFFSAQFIA